MSDETPKPKKALAVRKKRPQRLKVRPVEEDPVGNVHKVVHHVGEALKAGRKIYEAAKPMIDHIRGRKK